MKLDFWNNPLIVTSFRVRQRRGGINIVMLYPFMLLLIGVSVPYFAPALRRDWPRLAFYILAGSQFVLCGLFAGNATASSMRAEVLNQTLDFRRISCLSSRQIMLGKLLGEPAIAFFGCISTFPLGVLCWAMGGVNILVLVLMYVNLMTHILMCGAVGLVVPLELKEDRTVDGNILAMVSFTISLPLPFSYEAPLYLQMLAIYPFVHLLIAWLSFHAVERQLANPLYPYFSKKTAYALVFLADVIIAGLVVDTNLSFSRRCVIFCFLHLIVCVFFLAGMTPWRDTLRSWVWRFRGRVSWMRDSLLGDRAETTMAVIALCLLGLVNLGILVIPAAYWECDHREMIAEWPTVALCAGLTVLFLLAFGASCQWLLFTGRAPGGARDGGIVLLGLIALTQLPLFTGWLHPSLEFLFPFSPGHQYYQWFSYPDRPDDPLPILLVYGPSMIVVPWLLLRRQLALYENVVARRLEKMGVGEKTEN